MSEHNPLIDTQDGDSVVARIGDQYVTRTVLRLEHPVLGGEIDVVYADSRDSGVHRCYLPAWRAWCRKRKAEVVRDNK
jgi:hypothetical protein